MVSFMVDLFFIVVKRHYSLMCFFVVFVLDFMNACFVVCWCELWQNGGVCFEMNFVSVFYFS